METDKNFNIFQCSMCQEIKKHPSDSCTLGYGYDKKNNKICFSCCANIDISDMLASGRAILYLSLVKKDYSKQFCSPGLRPIEWNQCVVGNWPGSLKFKVFFGKRGKHNIAGVRYDVWFMGPDSKEWHGIQYGDNTQLCHCKRVKSR